MENLNQICRKIIQGAQSVNTNGTTNVVSGFLEILASMNQSIEINGESTEINGKSTNNTVITQSELVELPKLIQSDSEMNPELLQMLMNQQILQLNQNQGIEVTPENELSSKPIIIDQHSPILIETKLIKTIDTKSEPKIEFVIEPKTQMSSEIVEVLKESNLNEIQKHYKVLNQSIKSKDLLKSIDLDTVNTNQIKPTKTQEKEEIILKEVELNQFKQSIEEMKTNLSNISKKENETIIFKLKPEGLAEIVVKFEQKLGKVTLDISTSNKFVEQLIQKELPQLKEALKSYQMEINLNEMGYQDQANQSQQYKSHKQVLFQMDETFEQVSDEVLVHEWIDWSKPNGLNTYV